MPYVMVPVPEEHVEDVMQFVLRAIARASVEPWDDESMSQLFSDVDEPSRSLLSLVARATVAGADLSDSDAATRMQLSGRETIGILREVNEQARGIGRPPPINLRTVSDTLPNGRTLEKRVLSMDDDVAGLVRDAERADLKDEPHPLGRQPG